MVAIFVLPRGLRLLPLTMAAWIRTPLREHLAMQRTLIANYFFDNHFYPHREIKPVDEIEGIRCQRCSMILESGRESCSSENCSSRKHTDKEANKVSLEIGKSLEGDEEEEPVTYVDAESLGSIFTHHGSSMFLRLGALSKKIIKDSVIKYSCIHIHNSCIHIHNSCLVYN